MTALLELSTAQPEGIDKPSVEIDGEKYAIATKDDLPFNIQARMIKLANGMQRIDENLTEKGALQLEAELRWSIPNILPGAPVATLDKLSDSMRVQIISAFGQAAPAQQAAGVKKTKRKSKS